ADAGDQGTDAGQAALGLSSDAASSETTEPDTLAHLSERQAGDADDQDRPAASNFRVIERESEVSSEAVTPSFDIVRVDPLGNAVLAGRAASLAEVDIKVGDEVVDSVTATELGEWVSTPIKPLGSGDQEISLSASSADKPAIPSKQVVVVSIPEPAEQQIQVADKPVAVLLDKEKGGEGKILQAPGKLQGEGQLALKLVDYDDEGAIKLSGEAPPGVPVRVYIDNEPAALVIGDSKGYWITTLDRDLPGGDYTLRLDQLDNKGQTVARLETPLTRVTTPPVEGEDKVDYVVVQPGNSLWRIARRLSGDGFNYVYIFEANQAQIRDPNVIYPGQVFEVPNETGVAG
ncbi:MAG: LysM peptidoglycan-binding domain-containing protein, partial [Geminicoccaceae bacterium]